MTHKKRAVGVFTELAPCATAAGVDEATPAYEGLRISSTAPIAGPSKPPSQLRFLFPKAV